MKYDKDMEHAQEILHALARKFVEDDAISGRAVSRINDAMTIVTNLQKGDIFKKRRLKGEHYHD